MRDCFTPVESDEGKREGETISDAEKKIYITGDERLLPCVITAI